MFDIGAPEFLVLLVFAVILFGPEKLPELARKAARVVNYLRNIASNAQQQLGRELGPEFENLDVRDLSPKTFLQKHLLDEVQPIVADVKAELSTATTLGKSASTDVAEAIRGVRDDSPESSFGAAGAVGAVGVANAMAAATPGAESELVTMAPPAPPRVPTPFDPDAT